MSGYVSYALESNRYDVPITHECAVACDAWPCLGIVGTRDFVHQKFQVRVNQYDVPSCGPDVS
jgi:hypothetical protein